MDTRTLQSLEFYKVLAHLSAFAASEGGQKACLELRPFKSLAAIHKAAGLYSEGRVWLETSDIKVQPFPELDGLIAHLEGPTPFLDLDALWALRQVLSQLNELTASISESKNAGQWPLWVECCESLIRPGNSIAGLNRCIADDGHIRDEASPDLYLVRSELRRLHQQCSRQVKDFAREYNILNYLQDDFMTLSSDRYVLPLKSNFKGRLQGIIHDYSQTGETCYFEPLFLVEINNRLQDLKRQERDEERKILVYLTDLVRQELPGVRDGYRLLVDLDVLSAKKKLADCYDGRIPEFDSDRVLDLKDARHPLLLLAASGEERKKTAVPSDLSLKKSQQALIISGGNAGGKTVCLKTLGLVTLMGMAGLPVPVGAGSSLPHWSHVHAFIGDEQSLDDHVSTFTAQITHLSRIWPQLDAGSLVILDEFGAGTDPSQGAALAQAVVDSIMDKGAYVAAATHFPALKAYALSNEKVRAASVLFDPKTKKPLFKLIYDQVGASQALDVAREHGLPAEVLRRAEQYLLVSGEDTSALVERLNELAVEREAELEELKKKQARIEADARKNSDKFERERTRLFDSVQADAKNILREWKGSRVSAKQALKELSRVRQTLAKASVKEVETVKERGPALALADVEIGQVIWHLPWNRSGRVLEKDERKKRVRLDFSGVSLWADEGDLARSAGGKEPGIKSGRGYTTTATGASAGPVTGGLSLRLDLRGLRADVAISEVAKFLDNAVLAGRDEVEIIHGRGTGALRKEVHNFLKISPSATAFRLGNEDEGGDGVTIVTLQ